MSALDHPRAADQRRRALIDALPVGIHQSGPDGECVRVNKLWTELSGLDADEATGEGWAKAVHPGDRPRVLTQWRELVEAGVEFRDSEYRFLRPGGTVVRVAGSGVPLRGEDGRVTGFLGTCTPSPLDRSAHYFQVSRDMFVSIGFDGVFAEVGGDVEGVLGWSAEQMRGRRFTHFVHPDEVGLRDHELTQLLRGGVTVEFGNRYRTQKRGWRQLEWRAIGVPELELVYATARGREKQLDVASSDLEESLRVVTGFLELLERGYGDRLDEDGMQFVSAALSGARRMQRLIGPPQG